VRTSPVEEDQRLDGFEAVRTTQVKRRSDENRTGHGQLLHYVGLTHLELTHSVGGLALWRPV